MPFCTSRRIVGKKGDEQENARRGGAFRRIEHHEGNKKCERSGCGHGSQNRSDSERFGGIFGNGQAHGEAKQFFGKNPAAGKIRTARFGNGADFVEQPRSRRKPC